MALVAEVALLLVALREAGVGEAHREGAGPNDPTGKQGSEKFCSLFAEWRRRAVPDTIEAGR